jgi:hypothetical protein
MQIAPNTPTTQRSLGGILFALAMPYAAGHVLTEGEANQMNQVFAENVGNNLRNKISKGVVDADGNKTREYTPEEVQALVNAYVETYEPGVRARGEAKPTLDPVEREARKLAKEAAVQLIKDAGGNPKDYDIEPIIDSVYEPNAETFLKEAKKLLDQRDKAKKAAQGAEGIDLGSFLKPKSDAPDAA